MDPKSATAYYSRSLVYCELGDYDHALEDVNRAVELAPDSADAYVQRGTVYSRKTNEKSALADYEKAIELDPENGFAHYIRGAAYCNAKRWRDAIVYFNRALQLGCKWPYVYLERGRARFATDDITGAIADFSVAIELDPKFGQAFYRRALVYRAAGKNKEAQADLRRAREEGTASVFLDGGAIGLNRRTFWQPSNSFPTHSRWIQNAAKRTTTAAERTVPWGGKRKRRPIS